jgi:hypothetical protein
MAQLQDNTGSSCFTDNAGTNSWTDNAGNTLACEADPAPAPDVVKGNRGKGKKQQIYSQGPWAYR